MIVFEQKQKSKHAPLSKMNFISIFFLFSFFNLIVCQQTSTNLVWYIDGQNGNDSNNGTSLSTAWKSFSKLASLTSTINVRYTFVWLRLKSKFIFSFFKLL